MEQVVLVVHLLLAVALVGVVLLQKSEGGGLGIGGGGGMSGFMTGRSQANLLTRATAILAAAFMVTSLVLAVLASGSTQPRSILYVPANTESAPAPAGAPVPDVAPESSAPAPAPEQPAAPAPAAPAEEGAPATPSVPLGQ